MKVQHSVSLTTHGAEQQQPTFTCSARHFLPSLYVQRSALQWMSVRALAEEHPQEASFFADFARSA